MPHAEAAQEQTANFAVRLRKKAWQPPSDCQALRSYLLAYINRFLRGGRQFDFDQSGKRSRDLAHVDYANVLPHAIPSPSMKNDEERQPCQANTPRQGQAFFRTSF
jgi:hypothetical protein